MRSLPSRRSDSHALTDPSDAPAAAPTRRSAARAAARAASRRRVLRGGAHGVVLLALVLGTAAYAGAGATHQAETEAAPSPAVLADVLPDAFRGEVLLPEAASRSQARAAIVRTVLVSADGQTHELTTDAETVEEVLAEAGVVVSPDDGLSHDLTDPVAAGSTIAIARVTYVDLTERTELPFETTEKRDATLPSGEREVETAGVPGVQTVAYRVHVVDGVEVGREEVLRTAVEPVAEVVRVGTKPASTSASTSGSGTWVPGPVYEGDPRSIGRSMVAARGWGEDQWVCLDRLFTRESNWNPYAQNPSSGAYGIPQSLPGSKMGTVASDWRTNPATQITWGLNYIAGRYGTPCGAWAHSQSTGWY